MVLIVNFIVIDFLFIIQLKPIQKTTLCLVALLRFNDQVVDEFDFHIQPSNKFTQT